MVESMNARMMDAEAGPVPKFMAWSCFLPSGCCRSSRRCGEIVKGMDLFAGGLAGGYGLKAYQDRRSQGR